MAEESERREANGPPSGVDATVMALVGMSRDKADALGDEQIKLIAEQTLLARLQVEDLRREDGLRHWSLRVRHISDVMKLAFEFSMATILIAIVILIGGAVWSAAHDNGLVIEAFSVPPDLAAKGLTGEVVASKILDRLSTMQAETNSTRAASSYANNWGNDIKVQVPDTGVSVGEINKFLHMWLGHQTHIEGEVYRTTGGVAVTARVGDSDSSTFNGSEADLDSLIDAAARTVFRSTQPYRYSLYLRTSGHGPFDPVRHAQADAILAELIRSGNIEDRAWSYDAMGVGESIRGNLYRAVATIKQAIATKPTLDAYTDLAVIEAHLQHDEDVLETRKAAEVFAGADTDMKESAAYADSLFNRQHIALLLGDSLSALEYGRQVSAAPGGQQVQGPSLEDDLLACGMLHDPACLRGIQNDAPPPANNMDALTRQANTKSAEILLGQFTEAAKEARTIALPSFSSDEIEVQIDSRMDTPLNALIRANLGDFNGAHATIGKTSLDCEICLRIRGRIDALERNWNGADYWFARAVRFAPSMPFAYEEWGEMYLRKGDYGAAIGKFTLAHRKGPHFADPLEMWGEALIRENRSDLALAKFAEADKYAPNWGRLHLKWGEALVYAGMKDEAKEQFGVAASLDLSAVDKFELARMSAAHG